MTHTPAPWNVTPGGSVQVGTSYFVDHTSDDQFQTIPPADANMMAAAPDLFDALVNVLSQINHPDGWNATHPHVIDAKNAAYAAIDKARG